MVKTKRHAKASEEPILQMTEAERKAVKAAQDARVARGDLDAKWRREGKSFDRNSFHSVCARNWRKLSQHALFIIISLLTFS